MNDMIASPALPASRRATDNAATTPEEMDEGLFDLDFAAILSAIRRNWLAIVAIMVLAILAGIAITLLTTPRYQATASVLVEQEADQIIEGSDTRPAVAYQDADRFLQTQLDVLSSRTLAMQVLEDEGLADDPDFFAAMAVEMPTEEDLEGRYVGAAGLQELRRERAADLLQENLTLTLPVDSRVVSISFESIDPVMAARLANSFAENFIAANLNRRFDSSAYAREFLAQQLEEARNELAESERELNQYSRAAGLIRIPGQGQNADQETTLSVTNDTLIQINSAASQATADRIAAEKQWNSISRAPVLSIPQVLSNQAMQSLIRQRSEAEAALAEERARHLEDHPTVIAMRAQVAKLDSQIQEVGSSIKRSIQNEYQAAREREASLKNQVESLRSNSLTEQDRGVQYNVLKRVAETRRSLYDTLLERFNELNATAGATSNNVSLVDRAEVPRKPASPSLILNLLLAIIGGLTLAAAFVFLREHFDDAIRAPDDVERKLRIPLLGLVPLSEDNALDVAREDRKSEVSEAYHSLVANLFFATEHGLPKSLVITSSQASEGKTTTSNAIAIDIARLGRKVILVDGDLRRPTLHRLSNKPDKPGLPNVLSGQSTLDEVIFDAEEPNLSYMTALPIPPDPSLLLGSPRLRAMIDELESRFEVVIIDSPPMLGLSDAVSWAAQTDGVLLVIDASKGHRGAVKAAQRRLQLINAPVLGAVLTKFDPQAAGASNSYYGYNYYAYGEDQGAPG